MKSIFYNYRCNCCNISFKALTLPGELYGEFIMRSSKSGEVVYLNSFDDSAFEETEKLFKKNEMIKKADRVKDAEFFQSIFSVSCDLANDGSPYHIGLLPICPGCGSRDMAPWGATKPPEFSEQDIKPVSHERWDKLTIEEKKSLVDEAVNNYFFKEK